MSYESHSNFLGFFKSKVRRLLFLKFVLNPGQEFYVRELARSFQLPASMVQREIKKIAETGFLVSRKVGNIIFYKGDKKNRYYTSIRDLVLKTVGIGELLRPRINSIDSINIAFIYGSYVTGNFDKNSDIDVLIVTKKEFSDLEYEKINSEMAEVEAILSREINLDFYNEEEFKKEISDSTYLKDVLSKPKIFVKGGEDGLRLLTAQ
ncbi:MAG TPA: nucleotidyltransferase domain-containing protein [bacterium]|nr:nucleotidyltransferase domain-containing protein [bacterium]